MISVTNYDGSFWLKENRLSDNACKILGIGRCGFFLHVGSISNGCITVNRGNTNAVNRYNALKDLIQQDPVNVLIVVP